MCINVLTWKEELLLQEHNAVESPEEQEESIIDLAYLGLMFEEKSLLDFNIDKDFELHDELIETLMNFEEMFTSPLNAKHLRVPPFEIKLRENANLQKVLSTKSSATHTRKSRNRSSEIIRSWSHTSFELKCMFSCCCGEKA